MNPFKRLTNNSTQSSRPHPELRREAEAQARTCSTCGAPRPERTDLRICDYCGSAFMTTPDRPVHPRHE